MAVNGPNREVGRKAYGCSRRYSMLSETRRVGLATSKGLLNHGLAAWPNGTPVQPYAADLGGAGWTLLERPPEPPRLVVRQPARPRPTSGAAMGPVASGTASLLDEKSRG